MAVVEPKSGGSLNNVAAGWGGNADLHTVTFNSLTNHRAHILEAVHRPKNLSYGGGLQSFSRSAHSITNRHSKPTTNYFFMSIIHELFF